MTTLRDSILRCALTYPAPDGADAAMLAKDLVS